MSTKTSLNFFAKQAPTYYPMDRGWGNGYVCIPEGHPLHGKHYDDIHRLCEIDVNGGLTFSEKGSSCKSDNWLCPEFVKDSDWVVGFDTAHYMDTLERWPDEESVLREAERLAEQIEAYKAIPHQELDPIAQELVTRLYNMVNEFSKPEWEIWCDHSVGICACTAINVLDEAKQTLSKIIK